jgi:ATP/maltotriose-dependent transcriptional regulator MalT
VALLQGDLNRATALHEEGLTLLRAVGDEDGVAAVLGNLGYVALVRGDYAPAVAHSEESLARYRALKSVHGTAAMLGNLGRALLGQGDHERASGLLREGLVLSQELGNTWYTASALEGLAGLAAARGHWDRAAQRFGALEALVAASDITLHPSDRATNERYLATVRARLGASAFVAAWDAGRAMPFAQVVTEALAPVDLAQSPRPAPVAPDFAAAAGLTSREREVLARVAQGQTNKAIAEELFIAPSTVKDHVTSLFNKFGAASRAQLVAQAAERGLL